MLLVPPITTTNPTGSPAATAAAAAGAAGGEGHTTPKQAVARTPPPAAAAATAANKDVKADAATPALVPAKAAPSKGPSAGAAAAAAQATPGPELVGCDVKVFWPLDKACFKGTVTQYREKDAKHYGELTLTLTSAQTALRHRSTSLMCGALPSELSVLSVGAHTPATTQHPAAPSTYPRTCPDPALLSMVLCCAVSYEDGDAEWLDLASESFKVLPAGAGTAAAAAGGGARKRPRAAAAAKKRRAARVLADSDDDDGDADQDSDEADEDDSGADSDFKGEAGRGRIVLLGGEGAGCARHIHAAAISQYLGGWVGCWPPCGCGRCATLSRLLLVAVLIPRLPNV